MNRALRKRATKLRGKSLKTSSKLRGQDLQSVSKRLSEEQYAKTLESFENPSHKSAADLARVLAKSLMEGSAQLQHTEAPKFITQQRLQEIDCGAGCAWCCHQPMQVSALSAISVAAFLLEQERAEATLPILEDYVATLTPYGNDRTRLKECFTPCPFLDREKKCSVYEARPVLCRAFHSTEVKACQAVVEEKRSNRDVPMFANYFGFLGMRLSGACKALKDLGLDERPVVLATAVKMLLEDFEGMMEQWLEGEPVFEEAAIRS